MQRCFNVSVVLMESAQSRATHTRVHEPVPCFPLADVSSPAHTDCVSSRWTSALWGCFYCAPVLVNLVCRSGITCTVVSGGTALSSRFTKTMIFLALLYLWRKLIKPHLHYLLSFILGYYLLTWALVRPPPVIVYTDPYVSSSQAKERL